MWLKLSAPYRSRSDLAQASHGLALLRDASGGLQRLVWGSDWPNTQYEQQTDYSRQVAFLEGLLPDAAERAHVLKDNPAKLFGFEIRC